MKPIFPLFHQRPKKNWAPLVRKLAIPYCCQLVWAGGSRGRGGGGWHDDWLYGCLQQGGGGLGVA